MTTAGYDYFDVEADVGIRAWGTTPGEAFVQAARGVFALIVALAEVDERDTREIRAQGDSGESLLVNWIGECLYVHEVEGFVVHRIELGTFGETLIHAVLHGEVLDPGRHRLGTVVKGATYHGLRITARDGVHEVRLIVDV